MILSISPNPSPDRWKHTLEAIELFGPEVIPAFS